MLVNNCEWLTEQEKELVKKLENEMFFAINITQIQFYKKEIQTIISQAKRRQQFVHNRYSQMLL